MTIQNALFLLMTAPFVAPVFIMLTVWPLQTETKYFKPARINVIEYFIAIVTAACGIIFTIDFYIGAFFSYQGILSIIFAVTFFGMIVGFILSAFVFKGFYRADKLDEQNQTIYD